MEEHHEENFPKSESGSEEGSIYIDDPYCDKCDKIFDLMETLRKHNQEVHGRDLNAKNAQDPVCYDCDIVFKNAESLDQHNKETHPYLLDQVLW